MPNQGESYIPDYAIHPGRGLSEKLHELDLLPKDFARQIGVDVDVIVDIILEIAPVTPELAEAFEQSLKIPARFWLRKQKRYDEMNEPKVYIPRTVTHPGSTLSDKLYELKLSPGDFAEQIGIDWNIIVDIISEEEDAKITPELADIFEKALGISTQFWMNRQRQYDETLVNQQVTT